MVINGETGLVRWNRGEWEPIKWYHIFNHIRCWYWRRKMVRELKKEGIWEKLDKMYYLGKWVK